MLDQPQTSDATGASAIARIENLRVSFQTKDGEVFGVEDVSFSINPGETVCIVGESGSGKSVSSLSLMRLVEYGGGKIAGGHLFFDRSDGKEMDIAKADQGLMRTIRGNEIGMIFQEPMTALNPVFTVGRQLTEGLRLHLDLDKEAAKARAIELLREVRIPEPERRMTQYPHELSGGMRQRVVIAMALACKPRLLIADEPTTALDVTIQAEILALMDRLKRETGTAVMFITHDMAVVAQMADRVVVMFRGNKVEEGPVAEIFNNPQHDYTKALLAAVPKLGEMTGKSAPEPMRLVGVDAGEVKPIPGTNEVLLEVKNLTTRFPVKGGFFRRTVAQVHAVEDVSFTVNKGQTLSLVGESGCGKSSAGRSLLRLVEPNSGEIRLDVAAQHGFAYAVAKSAIRSAGPTRNTENLMTRSGLAALAEKAAQLAPGLEVGRIDAIGGRAVDADPSDRPRGRCQPSPPGRRSRRCPRPVGSRSRAEPGAGCRRRRRNERAPRTPR